MMQKSSVSEPAALALMEHLQVPLWLMAANGTALWLNRAARVLLRLSDHAAAATVAGGISDDVLATLEVVPLGHKVTGTVTFRGDALETIIPCRLCRVDNPAVTGSRRSAILAEAVFDVEARRQVIRLTEQLAAMSDAFPDLRLILRRDGTVVDVTAARPAPFAGPEDRLLHQRIEDALPEPAARRMAEALARVNAGASVAEVEFVLTGGDREQCYESRLVALPDGVRIMAIVRDVTERKRAELSALRAHGRLLDALDSLPEGMALFDADDRLVVANGAFLSLFGRTGRPVEPGATFEAILRAGVEGGLFATGMGDPDRFIADRLGRHVHPGSVSDEALADGRWFRVTERRTRENGIVSVWTDITAVKHREEELQRAREDADIANRRKTEFMNQLSRELRTPLNSVIGFADLLRSTVADADRDHADEILVAGRFMLDLVNDLMDLARIEAGSLAIGDEPCDLVFLLESTVAMLAPLALKHGVSLAKGPVPAADLLGEPALLRQMLFNLSSAAVRAGIDDGRRRDITISVTREEEGALRLVVEGPIGDGSGPVANAGGNGSDGGAARGAASGGAGYGFSADGLELYITGRLITLHDGRLDVLHGAPGAGTAFVLTFPPGRVRWR